MALGSFVVCLGFAIFENFGSEKFVIRFFGSLARSRALSVEAECVLESFESFINLQTLVLEA